MNAKTLLAAMVLAGALPSAAPMPAAPGPLSHAKLTTRAVPPDGPPSEPPARVNAQLIESAILALRKPIVAAQLPLEAPGVEEARAERRKLLGLLKTSKQENVVDLGGIRVSTEQKNAVPPWIGGVLAVAGLAVLLSGGSRKP